MSKTIALKNPLRFQVTTVVAKNDWWLEHDWQQPSYGAPQHGWDNPCDVQEAKQYCFDLQHWPLRNRMGFEFIFSTGRKFYDLGIRKGTGVALVLRHLTEKFSEQELLDAFHRAYTTAISVPGTLSRAGRFKANAAVALISANDDDPWPVGADDATWPKALEYKHKDNSAQCAEVFLLNRPYKLTSCDGVIFTLGANGVWQQMDDHALAAEIRATDPANDIDVNKIFLMVKAIHLARHSKARPYDWIDRPASAPNTNDIILAANGILNATTGELIPHNGRYFATGVPAWKFDPEAAAPIWIEKVNEWLHPSFHPTLQEVMGYLLTADNSIQSMFVLVGAKRGGKGTITRVIEDLIGDHHHASIMLNDLAGDFGLQGLTDKRLVIIPDAHDADVARRSAAIERIKSITGGDHVSVNRKNKTMMFVKVPARMMLVANKHPKFLDESGALAAREVVLQFERSFIGSLDYELAGKLRLELPGIANWAIEGLRRLRANGNRFTIGERGRTAQRELAESQSPALRFAEECLIVTGRTEDAAPLSALFKAYDHWADHVEGMSRREKRNKTDFKTDLLAALTDRGVRYESKKAGRWRAGDHGPGSVLRYWFTGLRLCPEAIVPD